MLVGALRCSVGFKFVLKDSPIWPLVSIAKDRRISYILRTKVPARVAELADAQDLKSCDLTVVRVQVPPRVLFLG